MNFTVFNELTIPFVSGVNIFIGKNGTGKTHLLKFLYSLLASIQEDREIKDKLSRVFLPRGLDIKRLVMKGEDEASFSLSITKDYDLKGFIQAKGEYPIILSGFKEKQRKEPFAKSGQGKPVYIPVKEMLANAPGFRSLYATREVHFEEIYFDIIDRALLPELKKLQLPEISDSADKLNSLLREIQKIIGGKVSQKNEEFYLRSGKGEIEFSLLAEGHRKLALLWLLIKNGCLAPGGLLFWDEPEANLNPGLMPTVVKTLLALEQVGVQIFIATHNYELLKEFDLQKNEHVLLFNSLFFEEKRLKISQASNYDGLDPNVIEKQFSRLYDLEIKRSLGEKYE
jgi:AAA15 family ATPase/GTPase